MHLRTITATLCRCCDRGASSGLTVRIRPGALERFFDRVLVPPTLPDVGPREQTDAMRAHDFRRVVAVVAATAVGFFAPSLVMAQVPVDRWFLFVTVAASVGLAISASFYLLPAGSRSASVGAAVNIALLAAMGALFGEHYHQLGLLCAVIVAAHAMIHGIYPALLAAFLGALVVPFVMQPGVPINMTDPGYALIYLAGAALVPWTAGRLAQRRAAALRAQLAATTATEREAVMILARASEAKDHSTGDHVVRVADLAAELADAAGMATAEREDVRFAAMLHDVGKLHLPDTLLQKAGPLTSEEWQLVKLHTIWGERILGSSAGFELARHVARWHHENFDGSGYPDGLRGDSIPLAARIVRVADVYDALSHTRPYKEAWDRARVLEEIIEGAGTRYDPELAPPGPTDGGPAHDRPAARRRGGARAARPGPRHTGSARGLIRPPPPAPAPTGRC